MVQVCWPLISMCLQPVATEPFKCLLRGSTANWSTTVQAISTDRMRVTLAGTTPLGSGQQTITRLLGSVPANAPYGASDLVRIENLAVLPMRVAQLPFRRLRMPVYTKRSSSVIRTRTASIPLKMRVTSPVSVSEPIAASMLTDHRSGDRCGCNADGQLEGLDSSWVARKGLSPTLQPQIPNLPAGSIAVTSGIDPTIAADSGSLRDVAMPSMSQSASQTARSDSLASTSSSITTQASSIYRTA